MDLSDVRLFQYLKNEDAKLAEQVESVYAKPIKCRNCTCPFITAFVRRLKRRFLRTDVMCFMA